MPRKIRTRAHILADYSGVYFEKLALDCGYSVERTLHDYGIDMTLFTYDAQGQIENDAIRVQLKATDNLNVLRDGTTLSLPVEWADLETWRRETFPVILVLYDKANETGYWIYIQRYLQEKNPARDNNEKTLNVHFDTASVLDSVAIGQFAAWKNELNELYQKVKETW